MKEKKIMVSENTKNIGFWVFLMFFIFSVLKTSAFSEKIAHIPEWFRFGYDKMRIIHACLG